MLATAYGDAPLLVELEVSGMLGIADVEAIDGPPDDEL